MKRDKEKLQKKLERLKRRNTPREIEINSNRMWIYSPMTLRDSRLICNRGKNNWNQLKTQKLNNRWSLISQISKHQSKIPRQCWMIPRDSWTQQEIHLRELLMKNRQPRIRSLLIKRGQMRPRSRPLIRKIRPLKPIQLLMMLPRRFIRNTHLLLPNQLTGLKRSKMMPRLLWTMPS